MCILDQDKHMKKFSEILSRILFLRIMFMQWPGDHWNKKRFPLGEIFIVLVVIQMEFCSQKKN